MLEAIGIAFVVVIWVISSLIKGFQWLLRQTGPPQPLPQSPPPSQILPPRAVPLVPARDTPRQPQAGGPSVPIPATTRSFRQQEQEAAASEPSGLNTLLQSPTLPAVQQNGLFSGTDDLVRAIILQEVLGPPLCRRSSASPQSSPSPQ